MLTKSQIKFIHSLMLKKHRDEEGLFVAEGVKICIELMNSNIKIKSIFAESDFLKQLDTKNYSTIEVFDVSSIELKKISSLTTPNKVVVVAEIPKYDIKNEDLSSQLSLILEDVQDPGNMGTIIRIADWFGITNIICSEGSVDAYNPKVIQATMGSISRVKVNYIDLPAFLNTQDLREDFKIFGAILGGESIYQKQLSRNGFIILGNESKGISEKLLSYVTDKISIPSFTAGKSQSAESLNVAIATALICSEFRRVPHKT